MVTKSTSVPLNDTSWSGLLKALPNIDRVEKGLEVCLPSNCAFRSRFSRRKFAEECDDDQLLSVKER